MRARHSSIAFAVSVVILSLFNVGPVLAAGSMITVTTTVDAVAADGQCSLREAIDAANDDTSVDACSAGTGDDTIDLPAGTYPLLIPGSEEDANATGDLDVRSDMSIVGAGSVSTSIDGAGLDRVLDVHGGAQVSLSKLQVTGGVLHWEDVTDNGGGGIRNLSGTVHLDDVAVTSNTSPDLYISAAGILNGGTMTIDRSSVAGNRAYGGEAGGILNTGTLTIEDSTIAGNSNLVGGGISNQGTLRVTGSTISGNSASETDYSSPAGGGLYNAGTATLVNSTVSGNSAHGNERASVDGAGIFNRGNLSLTAVTITDNHDTVSCSPVSCANAGHDAGIAGPAELMLTIVAGNGWSRDDPYDEGGSGAGPADCAAVTSLGGNVIGSTAECVVSGAMSTDRFDVDPQLGPLADNGGPTQTHAIGVGSPALDLVPSGTSGCGTTLATDQRGVVRPQGPECDSGAFEASVVFEFGGFFGPLRSSATARAGSAVPVIFSLHGDQGAGVFAAGSPASRPVSCSSGAALGAPVPTDAAGAGGLRYDPTTDRYTYAWKTRSAWAGSCRELVMTLTDGSVHRAWIAFR